MSCVFFNCMFSFIVTYIPHHLFIYDSKKENSSLSWLRLKMHRLDDLAKLGRHSSDDTKPLHGLFSSLAFICHKLTCTLKFLNS